MFGGRQYLWPIVLPTQTNMDLAPPQLSPAELKALEDEATLTIQKVIVGSILLYLCMSSRYASPFMTDKSLYSSFCHRCRQETCIILCTSNSACTEIIEWELDGRVL